MVTLSDGNTTSVTALINYRHLGKNRYVGIQDPTHAAVQSGKPQINLFITFSLFTGCLDRSEVVHVMVWKSQTRDACQWAWLYAHSLSWTEFSQRIWSRAVACIEVARHSNRGHALQLSLHLPHSAECSHIWFQSHAKICAWLITDRVKRVWKSTYGPEALLMTCFRHSCPFMALSLSIWLCKYIFYYVNLSTLRLLLFPKTSSQKTSS